MSAGKNLGTIFFGCSLALTIHTYARVYFNDPPTDRAARQTVQTNEFVKSLTAKVSRMAFVRFKLTDTCYAIGYDGSMNNRGGAMPYYLPSEACQKLKGAGAKFIEIDELATSDAGIDEIPDGGTTYTMVPDAH